MGSAERDAETGRDKGQKTERVGKFVARDGKTRRDEKIFTAKVCFVGVAGESSFDRRRRFAILSRIVRCL